MKVAKKQWQAGLLAWGLLISNPIFSAEISSQPDTEETLPIVQIAILLDTSSSMDGLIDQAKSQLWKIVNEFISAKQKGQTPVVQVALYEYGNSTADAQANYIRPLVPLSRDLDEVSEKLFGLTTNGGEEYCGAVIRDCISDLEWDASNDTYKAVFIAGNEPFTQGPIEPIAECRSAISKGIVINTIFCGARGEGQRSSWEKGADVADGKYLVIDQDRSVTSIPTPHDDEIAKLNEELNETYVYYGSMGREGKAKQLAQDKNAADMAPAAVQARVLTKVSSNYSNSRWDVVDAFKQKGFDIATIKKEDLPKEMQEMTLEERKAYVAEMAARRNDVKAKILEVGKKRAAFIAEKAKETGKDDTLGSAVTKAVREQAKKLNIVWEKE